MHEAVEAECAKNPYFRLEFAEALMEVVTGLSYNRDDCVENFEDIVTATAEQRAEAFVIVMTKSPTPWPGCRYLGADTWTTVKQKEVL
jgi:gamma-glutamylcysteine synthetase